MTTEKTEGRSALVHYFSVDLEAERRTFEGVPYTDRRFDRVEQKRIVQLAREFNERFERWLREKQVQKPELFCEYSGDALFSEGFFERSFHAYFGFTNFREIHTNIDAGVLREFVREFVRELSAWFPDRWWKFDYTLFFHQGRAFHRDTRTWELSPVDSPVSEEARRFLAS
jgi:hypothetical protein